MQFRVLATHCARGLQVILASSENQRAQGMPDARCTRGLMRNGSGRCAHEHTGQRRQSDIPCAMALRLYNALSPVSHILLPPSTPTMGRQDHTSLPYALMPFVFGTASVHRNPPHVHGDHDTPL